VGRGAVGRGVKERGSLGWEVGAHKFLAPKEGGL